MASHCSKSLKRPKRPCVVPTNIPSSLLSTLDSPITRTFIQSLYSLRWVSRALHMWFSQPIHLGSSVTASEMLSLPLHSLAGPALPYRSSGTKYLPLYTFQRVCFICVSLLINIFPVLWQRLSLFWVTLISPVRTTVPGSKRCSINMDCMIGWIHETENKLKQEMGRILSLRDLPSWQEIQMNLSLLEQPRVKMYYSDAGRLEASWSSQQHPFHSV